MTAEMNNLINDPDFCVEFAMGDPTPDLVPQTRGSGIVIKGVYFDKPKRYLMKKAHMSKEDVRIFDVDSGKVVLVSHHPGKNPYEKLDPLGLSNNDAKYTRHTMGAEWESACDVTGRAGGMPSFKIRPKSISRHGRQYIKQMNNETIMNIGKVSKMKTMSLRDHFMVGRGESKDIEYLIVADMVGRTFTIRNNKEEVIAQVSKTTKAMIKTAAFGSGSESTIDIAPGVDVSTILAIVYGIGQVGHHYVKDGFNSYVADPLKESLTGAAIETAGLEGVAQTYTATSNDAVRHAHRLERTAKFFNDTFFK
jgi:hypothetical protein